MAAIGLRRFRIDLLRENAENALSLIEGYARVIAGLDDGRQTWKHLHASNQFGLTRGTLQLV